MTDHAAVPQTDTNHLELDEGESMRLAIKQCLDALEQQMDPLDPPAEMVVTPKQPSQDDVLSE